MFLFCNWLYKNILLLIFWEIKYLKLSKLIVIPFTKTMQHYIDLRCKHCMLYYIFMVSSPTAYISLMLSCVPNVISRQLEHSWRNRFCHEQIKLLFETRWRWNILKYCQISSVRTAMKFDCYNLLNNQGHLTVVRQ